MKSVGYVVDEVPGLYDTFVGNEIRALQARGHRVAMLASAPARGLVQPTDLALAGSTYYLSHVSWLQVSRVLPRLLKHCVGAVSYALAQQALSPALLLRQALQLAVLVRRHGIAHLHAPFSQAAASAAIVAARMAGVSVSFAGQGADIYATPSDLPLKLSSADFAVASCGQSRLELQRRAPAAVIVEKHCGIDLKRFTFRPSLAEPNGRFLFVGCFREKAGVDVLLAALTAWPETRLDLVGDGPLLEEMKVLMQRMELIDRVTFRGPQPTEWLIQHAREYTALIAPFRVASDGDRPTSALVVKEAMALGLPVITSDLMGCSEILDEVSGWKVAPDDIDALCDAMQDCLRMTTGQRLHMVYAARNRIEKLYDMTACAAVISSAIEELSAPAERRCAALGGATYGVDG